MRSPGARSRRIRAHETRTFSESHENFFMLFPSVVAGRRTKLGPNTTAKLCESIFVLSALSAITQRNLGRIVSLRRMRESVRGNMSYLEKVHEDGAVDFRKTPHSKVEGHYSVAVELHIFIMTMSWGGEWMTELIHME